MTEITLFRIRSHAVGFEAEGHTGYAEEGSDIVCAAVSALTQGAAIGLKEVLGLDIALDISEGYMYCMLPKKMTTAQQHDAELILNTMAATLRSIAETNGDYIKMTDREV
jgi:uncharacterized protein